MCELFPESSVKTLWWQMSWLNISCLSLKDGHLASCHHLGVRLLGWWVKRLPMVWGSVRGCRAMCPLQGGHRGPGGPCSPWPWCLFPLTQSTTPHPKQGARIQTHICTKPGQWPLTQSINTLLAFIRAYNVMKSTCLKVGREWKSWWADSHSRSGKS